MSLYDGIEEKDKKEGAMGWNSASLSLMQQQIKLKKAQATTAMREKRLAQTAAVNSQQQSAAPSSVVDLTSKAGPITQTASTRYGKARKVVTDGLPLSFLPTSAKEEKIVIFGELEIENEYNPLQPNDYEKCLLERDAERAKRKAEDKAKKLEEMEFKQQRLAVRDEEREARKEHQKRTLGAAIAPPSALIEQDKRVMEEPTPSPSTFKPKFGAGSRGLNNAAKMMEKMGYKEGAGLGKHSQGMSTALQVEKIGVRGGAIIDADKIKAETEAATSSSLSAAPGDAFLMPPPPPMAAATDQKPITEVLKNPTKILLLKNMVGPGEVDSDLEPEVKEEMGKYGEPQKVLIYELSNVAADEAVRIFVQFAKIDHAIKAVVDLNGRFFGGRLINASFYPPDKFQRLDLDQ